MLTLYGHKISIRSNKVEMVANALGLEFKFIQLDLMAGEHKKPEFLAINPLGKIPAIDDDGFHLFESNAIIKYLTRKQGSGLYPQDLVQQAIVDQWLDFAANHIDSKIVSIVFNRFIAAKTPQGVDERSVSEAYDFLNTYLPQLDTQLAKNAYLAGEAMTLADINLLAIIDPVEIAEIDISPYTHLNRWRTALRGQEFYLKVHQHFGEGLKG